MKTEFRNRAFLPVVLPLAIMAFIAVVAVGFAAILLWNTREAALVVASVAAGGVLIAVALASSHEQLDVPKRTAVAVAGGLPLVAGLVFALGLVIDVDDSELMINVQPHLSTPEGAVTIGADSPIAFDADLITVPAGADVTVVFDNRNTGVPHNWALYADAEAALALTGEIAQTGDPTPGPDETFVTFSVAEGTYVYICDVHPNMRGELVAAAGAEPTVG